MKTFSNVATNSYIYCLEIHYIYLYTKVFKVCLKKTNSKRTGGKFGGGKRTQITFTCNLVKYQNEDYTATMSSQIIVNGAQNVEEYRNGTFYRIYCADKEKFYNILRYYRQCCTKNITLINKILQS